MHILNNGIIQIKVNQKGAELCSIKKHKTDKEYMWDANPNIWASYAPVLFPIIGCLKDNTMYYKGKAYHIPKHGFIRNNESILLESKTENSLTFVLTDNADTLKFYPFQFKFSITYTLVNNKIIINHTIVNRGADEMLFSLGAHPAFSCSINENDTYNDYYLEFNSEETAPRHLITAEGLISSETKQVIENGNIIDLSKNVFANDALVFKNLNSSSVSLMHKNNGKVLSVNISEFPFLGIWAKPKADFVCIEPWLGIADSWNSNQQFETKEGIIKIDAEKIFNAKYEIEIV